MKQTTDPKLAKIPFNSDAERALLGSFLKSPDVLDELSPKLPVEAFYDSTLRILYSIVLQQRMNNKPVDAVALAIACKEIGNLTYAQWVILIDNLYNCIPTADTAGYYFEQVLMAFKQRQLQLLCATALDQLNDDDIASDQTETQDFAERFAAQAESIVTGHVAHIDRTFLQLVNDRVQHYADIASGDIKAPSTISWGLSFETSTGAECSFDQAFGRMELGSLIAIGAITSHGKSVIGFKITQEAFRGGHCVALATLDMPANKTTDRIICTQAGVEPHKALTGNLDDVEITKIQTAQQYFTKHNNRFHLLGGVKTAIELRNWARRLKQKHNLKILCIDHFTRILPHKNFKDRRERFSETAEVVKNIAKELDIVVLLLCQLNREASKEGTMPQLRHFYETGAIEQEITTALMLFREDPTRSGIMHFEIGKNQNGACGSGKWYFDAPRLSITSRATL